MSESFLCDGIAKQELNLIFVIDISGSMEGERIGAVNNAIRDVMSIMPEIQDDTSDATIKISALTFSDEAKWVYDEPKSADEFKWNDVGTEYGTNLSAAYDALAKYLNKKSNGGEMPDIGGVAPIIILMTDGMPTSTDWEERLSSLRNKSRFKVALKYALLIGDECSETMDVLTKFTGTNETVLKVYSAETLRKVIKVIAVTASKVKSNSSSKIAGTSLNSGPTNNEIAIEEIANNLENLDEQDIDWD